MKSFESEIKAYAEKTRLKMSERALLRERILSYMEYHPLKKEDRPLAQEIGGDRVMYVIGWGTGWVRALVGGALIFLFVGVPFLAERAVPGDMLYFVKTGVNESIQTQLATSPYEKVVLETRLIERRIAEARVLAGEGKLTEEVEAQIAETVKGHAHAVQSGLTEMGESNTDDAALAKIVFSSALEVQSAVLGESSEQSSTSVSSILDVVNTVREEVRTDEATAAPSYAGISARIESETTRAYELFTTIKEGATEDEVRDIERRLSDIDRSIVTAKELAPSNEDGAIVLMVDTLGLIQKLIAFMTDIDIREAVALETLVPVSLTPEEEHGRLGEMVSILTRDAETVRMRIPLLPEEALGEKVAIGLTTLDEHLTNIQALLSDDEFKDAEAVVIEARIVADDLLQLTASVEIVADGVPPTGEISGETSTSTIVIGEGSTVGTTTPTSTPVIPEPIVDTTPPVPEFE